MAYFKEKEAKGYICRIYSSDGKTDLGNGYYNCSNNDQQITITDVTGKVITGSVVDLTVELGKEVSVEEINKKIKDEYSNNNLLSKLRSTARDKKIDQII